MSVPQITEEHVQALEQKAYWINKLGGKIWLKDMEQPYIKNLMTWLRNKKARDLAKVARITEIYGNSIAEHNWIVGKPLFQELKYRNELATCLNCDQLHDRHAASKCLYDATTFMNGAKLDWAETGKILQRKSVT